jgi:hypothetical protein
MLLMQRPPTKNRDISYYPDYASTDEKDPRYYPIHVCAYCQMCILEYNYSPLYVQWLICERRYVHRVCAESLSYIMNCRCGVCYMIPDRVREAIRLKQKVAELSEEEMKKYNLNY